MEASAKPRTYEPDEVEAKLKEHGLDDWYLEGDWIRRKYNTDGWPSTLMAVNAVGYVCEAAYHHADLSVTWGKLWVKLKNHAAGGITDKDFAVARQIEGRHPLAATLLRLDATLLDHCQVAHLSAEPAHGRLCAAIGKRPLRILAAGAIISW